MRKYVIKRHLALFKLSLLKLKFFKETISATFLMYQAKYILTSLLKGRGEERSNESVRRPSELSILIPWRGEPSLAVVWWDSECTQTEEQLSPKEAKSLLAPLYCDSSKS